MLNMNSVFHSKASCFTFPLIIDYYEHTYVVFCPMYVAMFLIANHLN